MRVGWFSCGCSSLVACKLARPDKVIYIHVTNQHPDTIRFLSEAGRMLGDIEILQSMEYVGLPSALMIVDDVWVNIWNGSPSAVIERYATA